MCLHRIPKGDCWVHLLSQIRKAISLLLKSGSFLEKKFLSKEVSGRNVELDKVIVPSPELESSSSHKSVLLICTPISEEANDDDHETSDQITTEPRRSSRVRPHQSGTVILF